MASTRKICKAPSLPENPIDRLDEIKRFRNVLSDSFYDYGIYNVYDSVFFDRIQVIMQYVNLEDHEKIRELGSHIVETNSTDVKLFIKFFSLILELFDFI
jgi:hypothetical protein